MLKKLLLSGAAASGLLFASTAQASYISIDEFDGPTMSIELQTGVVTLTDNQASVGDPTPGPQALVPDSIIGRYRDMRTEVFANPDTDPGGLQTKARVSFSTGQFTHSQDSQVISNTLLTWDGLASAGLGAAGNFAGLQGLEIGLVAANVPVDWLFTIEDADGSVFEATASTGGGIVTFTPIFLSFGDFAPTIVGETLDLANITSISLLANSELSNVAFDTTVDYLRAVPEPITVGLFGLGLLGLSATRRRKAA